MFKKKEKKYDFTIIESHTTFKIVYMNKTKVMYSISSSIDNSGTLTLLVNSDGSPMIYEGDENKNEIIR